MLAGTRTDINNIVCLAHGVLVMLNDDQGIAQVAQTLECGQKLIIILLMQADARLIQNIENAGQTGADLGSQSDSLGFTA